MTTIKADAWGHLLTTENADAANNVSEAISAFIEWRTDAMAHLDAAIEADPDFALPYAIKGILITGLRKPELNGPAKSLLDKACAARPTETEREAKYVAALDAAIRGEVTTAAAEYEAIARAHPHDLVALRLAQMELFWIGEVGWMRDISERAAPAWTAHVQGFGRDLSVRAFGLEEKGDYLRAEAAGARRWTLIPAIAGARTRSRMC